MKIVQFKNGRFGVRRGSFWDYGWWTHQFLDYEGTWVKKQGYNIGSVECYSKEEAERRLKDYIESEASYQAFKASANDMGKPVK
ncbi:hypothetical protein [Xanthomonas phage X1]|nr:hypothetical protein [Xanthomonas phage X1]